MNDEGYTDCFKLSPRSITPWCFPFYKTTFSNGQKMRDGNPIISAKSIDGEIVRVIQEAGNEEDAFASWQTTVSDVNEKARKLVIVCTLHKAHVDEVER